MEILFLSVLGLPFKSVTGTKYLQSLDLTDILEGEKQLGARSARLPAKRCSHSLAAWPRNGKE